GALHRTAMLDHQLHRLLRDVTAHAIVDAPAGKDYLRVVADLLRLIGQIVGINANAVATDEAGPKRQEIPFRARDLQYFHRVDIQPIEDDCQLVDEGGV